MQTLQSDVLTCQVQACIHTACSCACVEASASACIKRQRTGSRSEPAVELSHHRPDGWHATHSHKLLKACFRPDHDRELARTALCQLVQRASPQRPASIASKGVLAC